MYSTGPHTLRKYLDWNPKGAGVSGTIFDTGHTATVPAGSRLFPAGKSVIYEIVADGTLKSRKDATATGGSLLAPSHTYGRGWDAFKKIWSDNGRIFGQREDGSITVYKQGAPDTGAGAITIVGTIAANTGAAIALKAADDVWGAGSKVYALTNGEIKTWDYTESGAPSLTGNGTSIATGLAGAEQGWSPGAGATYTYSGALNYSGVIRGYTGSPLTLANDDVRTGIYGIDIFADTASCLSATPDTKPYFGTPPDDSDTPEAPAEPPAPEPEPSGPATVSGKFTLGNGAPAPGLTVTIEPTGLVPEDGSSERLPALGTATTAADGTWSVTLPEQLPAEVQAEVDDNGGALNVSATTLGKTSSGAPMIGIDHLVAAPPAPATRKATTFAATMRDVSPRSVALLPLYEEDDPNNTTADPTPHQMSTTYAAEIERRTGDPGSAPVPVWQNDRGPSSANHNPYLVKGRDVSAEPVTRDSGNCYNLYQTVSTQIGYTVVGEGHAYYDAKASMEYESKLSTSVDVAYKSGNKWVVNGTVALGSDSSATAGFDYIGPNFGKQWRVPIEYRKQKMTHYCGATPMWSSLKVIAGRYKVPAGGPVALFGRDVKYKDGGANFYASPKANRNWISRGGTFYVARGRSIKFTGAVSVFGLSLSSSTGYDSKHTQKIKAGWGYGQHDIWGHRGPVSPNPGVVYSY
ncbi:hypothetical protein [Streptomyces sp. SYSU K21746]